MKISRLHAHARAERRLVRTLSLCSFPTLCALVSGLTGCASWLGEQQQQQTSLPSAQNELSATQLPVTANPNTTLPPLQRESEANKNPIAANSAASVQGEVALLKVEIASLKEKVATLQRKFDVILKGQRSGLYDEASSIASAVFQKSASAQKNPIPPLNSDGPIDRFENDTSTESRERAITPEKPQQLIDKANLLLEQREFGRVAQLLENFQQRFPNNGLSATAQLTLAEAYVELKSPQQALTHVRTFYLQHPHDVLLVRAKWLEARAQELLDAPQKAAALFREVIALEPQSQLALSARAALEKIAGGSAK